MIDAALSALSDEKLLKAWRDSSRQCGDPAAHRILEELLRRNLPLICGFKVPSLASDDAQSGFEKTAVPALERLVEIALNIANDLELRQVGIALNTALRQLARHRGEVSEHPTLQ